MIEHCPKCGKNIALVGRRHDCVVQRTGPPITATDIKDRERESAEILNNAMSRAIEPLIDKTIEILNAAGVPVCPECKQTLRPMTPTEKQRAYRQRKGAKS